MKVILALRGIGNSGKTETITLLRSKMLSSDYERLPEKHEEHGKDFLDIMTKKGEKIGITSSGDNYDLVHDRLVTLTNEKCKIIVCACRTRGGTNEAIEEFDGYTDRYVEKTYEQDAMQHPRANRRDADRMLDEIETLL